MHNFDSQTIQLGIIAVAGLAVVMQAIVLLAIFLSVKKAASSLQAQIDELRSSVMPIINESREFFTRVAPKIEATTTDVADLAHGLRVQIAELESSTTEILGRVQRQSARVDSMLSDGLDAVDRVGGFVSETVGGPMRQISGLLAAVKAAVEVLRAPAPKPRPTPTSGDEDMSI